MWWWYDTGLVAGVFLLGYGLVEIPRSMWNEANPEARLRSSCYRWHAALSSLLLHPTTLMFACSFTCLPMCSCSSCPFCLSIHPFFVPPLHTITHSFHSPFLHPILVCSVSLSCSCFVHMLVGRIGDLVSILYVNYIQSSVGPWRNSA